MEHSYTATRLHRPNEQSWVSTRERWVLDFREHIRGSPGDLLSRVIGATEIRVMVELTKISSVHYLFMCINWK